MNLNPDAQTETALPESQVLNEQQPVCVHMMTCDAPSWLHALRVMVLSAQTVHCIR